MKFDEYYEARNFIEDLIRKDLYGPVKEDEIIDESPSLYYSIGILFPKDIEIDEFDIDEIKDLKEVANFEEGQDMPMDIEDGISFSNLYKPSSFAISTTIKAGVDKIKVKIQYSKYHMNEETEIINKDGEEKFIKKQKWKRIVHKEERTIKLEDINIVKEIEVDEGLSLQVHLHNVYEDKSKTITVVLVNTYIGQKNMVKDDSNSFFQVGMDIMAVDEKSPIFATKRMLVQVEESEEQQNLDMLYGNNKNYAIGHGCAVAYETNEYGCYKVKSSFIPSFELKQMKPQLKVNTKVVEMKFLANGSQKEVISKLLELVESYDEWIGEQKIKSKAVEDRLQHMAIKNLKMCKETSNRIKKGIELLEDKDIFSAFQLANEAMLRQRVYYLKKKGKNINYEEINWYPFQLAFILLEIDSMANQNSDYRNIVDILWFPTGGGKTEAYLGVAAFVIFLRRIKYKDKGAGVTVIMRYTLRLLTIQQFERAAALICCCDEIREEKEELLGKEKISIGLFVGSGMTPNTLDVARINLDKINSDGLNVLKEGDGNPCQLLECPICGSQIKPSDYMINEDGMTIYCPNSECRNNRGAPIYLIDDDIYEKKPTLIISTVDKFARMTWEPKMGNIFGINTDYDSPELIIQDELHLITGPLGTITGLYETAIDYFCMKDSKKPKLIASTATIGNAESQVLALYGRDCRLFPSQGIDIKDSYFAIEANLEEKPGRKYIGILSPSKTPTTILIRVYGCLQFATRYLIDAGYRPEVIDNYWTILGYFNSLRELGAAVNQVYDNVQERYSFLYNKKFKDLTPTFTSKERCDTLEELTSRKSSAKIAEILKGLENSYKEDDSNAFDYVLASNMISVGIDIDRLGLMAMTGQPKSNSEYIQASSRVGRQNPGLVVVIYNTSRTRERSHYEQFNDFHSSIYKYVEPNSLTPFSMGARNKALHATYISMCRQTVSYLRGRDDADNFRADDENLKEIEDYIIERAEKVVGKTKDYYETIEEIEMIKELWETEVKNSEVLSYDKYGRGKPLLGTSHEEDVAFRTLNSMRNVDLQCNIYLEDD
ncbi:helicase-related protein [Sporanaerobacter acetigenes]|uniref:Helicase conserved C-terminal domain-containing protein n=1 Tax=Sporanaerobacter acetigenes DSM 13106 TaxID=1123281 RepID=A0A1M5SRK8_9FIRM|nr:helicase-related protein [Sporanaerobacter acetigenes]SHH41161.1 Helicase conserved C-terminal domain-containing protein [Sporanaerobacter acetigenes DSM 13106]